MSAARPAPQAQAKEQQEMRRQQQQQQELPPCGGLGPAEAVVEGCMGAVATVAEKAS